MGTNYYVVPNHPSVRAPIHIGKSSAGWLFHFQRQNEPWLDPPVVWNTYDQVKAWLLANTVESSNYVIIDEYDEVIPYNDFIKLVDEKQKDPYCQNNPGNFVGHCQYVDGYRFDDDDFW